MTARRAPPLHHQPQRGGGRREADATTSHAPRYGTIEYLADAVIVLRYVRESDVREIRLGVEIRKIRNADHSREV